MQAENRILSFPVSLYFREFLLCSTYNEIFYIIHYSRLCSERAFNTFYVQFFLIVCNVRSVAKISRRETVYHLQIAKLSPREYKLTYSTCICFAIIVQPLHKHYLLKFWVLTGLIANQKELIYQEKIFKAEERRVCP